MSNSTQQHQNSSVRFGVQTWPQNTTWRDLRDTWKLIEAAGFDTAWTFDHFYPILDDPRGDCLEGWTSLAALAVETSRVRIGTLVTGNTYRNPALLAKMASTLDHISGGRLILGIGAAWFDVEHRAYHFDFPSVGDRIDRFDEACEVITRLWSDRESNFRGRFYRLEKAYCEPKPVQKPHPPILIGGGGEKKMLRVVAKHADEWNWFGDAASFRHKSAILREHCAAVGRDFSTIRISWTGAMAVTDSTRETKRIVDAYAAKWGKSPADFAPASMIGSPDEIEVRIRELAAAGVDHFILSMLAPYDRASIKRFAEDVIPRFR